MPEVASLDVAVNVKLDQFQKGLTSAQRQLQQFDTNTAGSQRALQALEASSERTANAMEALATQLSTAQQRADDQAAAINRVNTAIGQISSNAQLANDNINQSTKAAIANGDSWTHVGKELLTWVGYTRLAIAVAKAGSPEFTKFVSSLNIGANVSAGITKVKEGLDKTSTSIKNLAPVATQAGVALGTLGAPGSLAEKAGKTVASMAPAALAAGAAIEGIAPALAKARTTLEPFVKIAGAAEVVTLGTHFKEAAVAATALSPAVRQVATHEVTDGIKAIPAAISTIAPAASSAGGIITNALLPRLASFVSFAAPIALVGGAVVGVTKLFELGADTVAKFSDELVRNAATGGVTVEFLQRAQKAAEDFKIETESVNTAIAQFNKVNQEALGGSVFQRTLNQLVQAGNFANNSGLAALKTAVTTEQRWAAVATLITEASQKGERLAALKLAETFLPEDMMQRLRAMPDYLTVAAEKAKDIESKDLINQSNIIWAGQLKNELDASTKILADWWKAKIPGIETASLAVYSVYVKMVTVLAQVVQLVDKIVGAAWDKVAEGADNIAKKFQKAVDTFNEIGREGGLTQQLQNMDASFVDTELASDEWSKMVSDAFVYIKSKGKELLDKLPEWGTELDQFFANAVPPNTFKEKWDMAIGAISDENMKTRAAALGTALAQMANKITTSMPLDALEKSEATTKQLTDALDLLKLSMGNVSAMAQQGEQALRTYFGVFGDTSKAVDGAEKSLRDAIKAQQSQAEVASQTATVVGKGAAAIEKMKVEATLLALAARLGITDLGAWKKEIEDVATAAGKSAQQTADANTALEHRMQLLSGDQAVRMAQQQLSLVGQTTEAQERARLTLENKFKLEQEAVKAGRDQNDIDQKQLDLLNAQSGAIASANAQQKLKTLALDAEYEKRLLLAGLGDNEIQIGMKLKDIYGGDVVAAMNSDVAAALKLNTTIKELRDQTGEFINTFVQGLVEGKSLTDSLSAAVKSLGASISQAASKQLGSAIVGTIGGIGGAAGGGTGLSGFFSSLASGAGMGAMAGPIGALAGVAIGAGVSLLGNLLGKNKEAEQAAAQASQQMTQQLQGATQSMQGLVGQLQSLNQTGNTAADQIASAKRTLDETLAAAQNVITIAQTQGGVTINAAIANASAQQAWQSIQDAQAAYDQFRVNTIDNLTKAMQAAVNVAAGKSWINDITTLFDKVAEAQAVNIDPTLIANFLTTSAQAIVDSAQLTGAAFDELIATFPQLKNAVHEFSAAAKRSADEIKSAADSLQARLLAATVDTSTLEGALAVFDLKAEQERAAEVKAGGQNLVLLEMTQAAERLQIIKQFNDQAIANEKAAAQQRLDAINAAAKNIVDYVNSLFAGPESTLSPVERLAAAQATYQATLAIAQQGNIDAQNKITSVAEDFRKALRDVYGSTQQYQQGVQTIASQLLNLPAAQQATDPVVQAIRDSIAEQQKITLNTGNTKTAVDTVNTTTTTGNQLTADTTAAVNLVKAATDQVAAQTQAIVALTNVANQFAQSTNTLTAALVNLQTIAQQQLDALNAQFAAAPVSTVFFQTGGSVTAQNNMVTALNKIVLNTYATAYNTAGTWSAVHNSAVPSLNPVAQTGGLVTGGVPGRDSVMLRAMPGEFIVNAVSARRHLALLHAINDNRPMTLGSQFAVGGEVRALISELRAMRQDMMRATVAGAEHVREGVDSLNNTFGNIARENALRGQAA